MIQICADVCSWLKRDKWEKKRDNFSKKVHFLIRSSEMLFFYVFVITNIY